MVVLPVGETLPPPGPLRYAYAYPHASLRRYRPQVSFGGSLVCTKLAQMESGPRYAMQRSVHKAQGQHVWPGRQASESQPASSSRSVRRRS